MPSSANLLRHLPTLFSGILSCRAITLFSRPTQQIRALASAGHEHFTAARRVADNGLKRFSKEVSLTGLATDLALAQGDPAGARLYMNSFSDRLLKLPQWRYRQGLAACLDGQTEEAADVFGRLLREQRNPELSKKSAWIVEQDLLEQLSLNPAGQACSEAAYRNLD